jgi:CRP-like cAMP-binding protein
MRWTRGRAGDAKIERLRQLPLLRCCSDEEVRRLAAAGELVEMPAGTVLQHEGRDVDWLHLVVQGEVSGPGQPEAVIGQTAVLAGAPASEPVWALTDTLVLLFGRREFRAAMDASPGFRGVVITSMAQTVAAGSPERSADQPAGIGKVYQLPARNLVSAS